METLPSKIRIPDNHTSKPKPVREQPQGLKQRFFPIGADIAPSIVDADMMDIDEPEPEAQEGSKKKKKHKSSHGADESGEKRKKKKSKKEAAA